MIRQWSSFIQWDHLDGMPPDEHAKTFLTCSVINLPVNLPNSCCKTLLMKTKLSHLYNQVAE